MAKKLIEIANNEDETYSVATSMKKSIIKSSTPMKITTSPFKSWNKQSRFALISTSRSHQESPKIKTLENIGFGTLNLSTFQSSKSTVMMATSERKKTDDFFKEGSALLAKKKNAIRVNKLFEAAKKNRNVFIEASGHIFDKMDVNERDSQGNVPLYYTAKFGNIFFSEFLINTGARVNEICSNDDTPMHMACQSNNFEVIMLMITCKGSMNAVNKDGLTPLAFLNESNLKRLDMIEGIASVQRNEGQKKASLNNDARLHHDKKKKEAANELLIHSFEPTIHHPNDNELVNNKGSLQMISSFRNINAYNEIFLEKKLEKEESFQNKLKKISFDE